jgi:hypothetical protein
VNQNLPIVDGNDYYIPSACQIPAIENPIRALSAREGAAVDPKHNWL